MSNPTVFSSADKESPVFESIVPLMAYDNHRNESPSGSAVFVAPGIALTATHVIQDWWKQFRGETLDRARTFAQPNATGFGVLAQQVKNGKPVAWKAVRFWAADPLDIAVLELLPDDSTPVPNQWAMPILQCKAPPIGSTVFALGFPKSEVFVGPDGHKRWRNEPFVTVGEVVEVHPQRRDNSRLKFPCFRTNARFDGGMSGGPVFSSDGNLCGIICSEMAPVLESDERVSYASLVWPALGIYINSSLFPAPHGGRFPMLELAARDIMTVQDPELVRLQDGQVVLTPPR